jgi:Mn2+/Fe2+ NRAMP family transporter
MASSYSRRQLLSAFRQKDTPIGAGRCHSFPLQPGDGLDGGDVGNTNISRTCLAGAGQQVGDELDVVLKQRRRLSRTSIALTIAGMVNMAMVMMASGAFHAGHSDVAEIETAYHTLTPLLGVGAAGVFLLSLIASGISSSTVGTMAGQLIMQGFVGLRIPIWARRLITMVPAFVVVGLGANATSALVISQVVLSIALPLPMIALLIFTRRSDIMGQFANGRLTNIAAIVGTTVVLGLNVFLIMQTFGVPIPALSKGG